MNVEGPASSECSDEWSRSSESSETEVLIDFLEAKFKDLVDEKVDDAERVFDRVHFAYSLFGDTVESSRTAAILVPNMKTDQQECGNKKVVVKGNTNDTPCCCKTTQTEPVPVLENKVR